MVGGGSDTTERLRSRVARGRPNWWVILAVSLALMALLVATAGTTPRRAGQPGGQADAAARDLRPAGAAPAAGTRSSTSTAPTTTTTTLTTVPKSAPSASATSGTSLVSAHALGTGAGTPMTTVPSVATTTLPPPTTTTTTIPTSSQPADRMQTQGYLDPPLQSSNGYGFTGTGGMQISVLWSGTTYLTMTVSCPSGSQSVGGTSAMEASLGDASGSCQATVSEPSSESVALTYTITIGPAGG
ncbi:MAG: hypothetical protein ABSE98_10010 [Acidimicrobiales bacterium]